MTGDYVEYDYTTGEERLSGSHLEQNAIIVEPVRPWGMAVLDWLDRRGVSVLWLTSGASVAMWVIAIVCAWLGMSAAGYFEVPQ
jgi:hypothetical protein